MTKQFVNRVLVVTGLLLGSFALAQAVIVGSLPYNLTNGSTADASQVMANYQKIITDVNANAAHNGVNADITALTALSTPITVAQGGTAWFNGGTSTGSANAQTVASVVPTGMILSTGQGVCFNAGFTNTGATTLVANGLTAKNVFRQSPSGNQALTGGEIVASSRTCAQYDGTQYVLMTSGAAAFDVGPATNLTAAATTDLGTIASHNVTITGNTGITAFGSTASATFPVYQLKFTGTPAITYNATSMITPGARSFTASANSSAVALYLGSGNWQILSYTSAEQPPSLAVAVDSARGAVVVQNSGTPTTQLDVSATSVVMTDSNGYGRLALLPSVTINAATTGANGLDAGALANSTWYYAYLINNGTTTAGLLSTSATAPTLPSGYVYKAYVGEVRTAGAATFFRTRQIGREVRFISIAGGTTVALPLLLNPANSQTRTALAWAACAPPAASKVTLIVSVGTNTNSELDIATSSDAGYTAGYSVSAPPQFATRMNATPNTNYSAPFEFLPESGSIYYTSGAAANANDGISCYGWTSPANVS